MQEPLENITGSLRMQLDEALSKITALEAHAKAFEARCLALSKERGALEARLAEAETHRDKNRETAISSQQWVNQLEARCVQLEDNLRIAVKVGLDDQARIAQLEAALASIAIVGTLYDAQQIALNAIEPTALETTVEPARDPCGHPEDARGGVDRDYCLLCGATVSWARTAAKLETKGDEG